MGVLQTRNRPFDKTQEGADLACRGSPQVRDARRRGCEMHSTAEETTHCLTEAHFTWWHQCTSGFRPATSATTPTATLACHRKFACHRIVAGALVQFPQQE